MDILNYIDKMQQMYGDKEPSSMVQEPRRTGFSNGGSYDYGSMQYKIDSVKAAYRRYKKGSQTGGRGGKMTFEQFAPIWAKENFADGGRIGFKDGTPIKFDESRVKIPTGKFVGEGRDKSQIFKIKNTKTGSVKYTTTGAGGGTKKLYNSIEEVKKAKLDFLPDELVKTNEKRIKQNIQEVTYKNKKTSKIVTKYKPFIGPDKVTIEGKGADTLKEAEKFVADYFKKNPKQIRVRDPKKNYASKDVRTKALKETDSTKAKGTKKFNYHHVRQIAGGVPLTTDDVMIINQRINSALGTKYNQPLNAISVAIQKNNKLALEAMNAKNEGLALEYMKRSDNLNAQAEKIVNSAIDKLPKKYKGYVGFNQFTLPRNEYGFPISNEPMIIKKIGGMPVSKNAIDLTTLDLKQEAEFRKIVREQAEAGKTGKINLKTSKALLSFMKRNGIKCNLSNGINCGRPEAYVKSINELKAKAAAGDKKAAEQLVKVTKGISKGGTLLRSLIGPGAILAEPVFEGVIAANKVLNGKPLNQAWAESYLSYLDSERVDPKTLERDEMLYRQIEGPERKVKGGQGTIRDTINIDAPGASKLRPLFAAEDTMAAFKKAKADKEKVFATRGVDRLDIRDKAAADIRDMRKTGSVDFAQKILNDSATQKALSDAQEYIAAKRGENRFSAQSAQADENRRRKAMKADGMLTIEDAKNELQGMGDYFGQGYTPFGLNKLLEEYGMQNPGYGITKVGPATGKYNQAQGLQDYLNSMRMQQIADAGGVANLAGGGIAGLSGGDKSGRPPESGPASQGLRSLIKNGRKL